MNIIYVYIIYNIYSITPVNATPVKYFNLSIYISLLKRDLYTQIALFHSVPVYCLMQKTFTQLCTFFLTVISVTPMTEIFRTRPNTTFTAQFWCNAYLRFSKRWLKMLTSGVNSDPDCSRTLYLQKSCTIWVLYETLLQ